MEEFGEKYKKDKFFVSLTPTQYSVMQQCIKLLPIFKIIIIKGDNGSGKFTIAKEIFNQTNAIVECFDLCKLGQMISPHELSAQFFIDYLETLLFNLNNNMNNANGERSLRHSLKRSRMEEISKFSLLSLNGSRKGQGIIYIRDYHRIVDVVGDTNSKVRFLLPLLLKSFSEKLPADITILMTTHGCLLPEYIYWSLDLSTTREDMQHVINPYISNNAITTTISDQILKISKIIPVGRIVFCLNYALAVSSQENDVEFINSYKKALQKFSGSLVEVEKDVPNPVKEYELIGLDKILDEINTSIINPMKLAIPGISIKKGILLCGPPGTGKTTIGRWLAHQIKGKFYLVGNEDSIRGNDIICRLEQVVRKANDNGPAVIFVDDCDTIFKHDDAYRGFLTVLDGIETNKRADVCFVLTCMNLRNVPASLLRGGRIEMVLFTKLPSPRKIYTILDRLLHHMISIVTEYNPSLSFSLTKEFISSISLRMSGWNCADIHRCVNDVSRLLISNKGSDLKPLFEHCIKQITQQYTLCAKCETTNLTDTLQNNYIM